MTNETPNVELDINLDEIIDDKIILWRGNTRSADSEGSVTFEVFAGETAHISNRRVLRRGARLITGEMQSTGCAHIQFEPMHLCSWAEWQACMRLQAHLYVRAWDLMGCEPDIVTDADGVRVLRAAAKAREAERVQNLIDKAIADTKAAGIAAIHTKA